MRATGVAIALTLFASPASAICISPGPYSTNDEYLACRINELVEVINDHANIINDQSRQLKRLEQAAREDRERWTRMLEMLDKTVTEVTENEREQAGTNARFLEMLAELARQIDYHFQP